MCEADGARVPAGLREALCGPPNGRVAIVVGAGCSLDPPTSKKPASHYARIAYRRLVETGTLEAGCCDENDLGAVADAVFQKDGSQDALVNILRPELTHATPNNGHKIAAALMAEKIIGLALTLNFDRALDYAVALIAPSAVTIRHSMDDHHHHGRYDIVYLHGDVEAPANAWVLRAAQIDSAWRNTWQQYVVTDLAQVPHVVFAGVGSPTPVITETLNLVRDAIPQGVTVYQVDALEKAKNNVANALAITDNNYVVSRWAEFMEDLGRIAAREFVNRVSDRYPNFCAENKIVAEDANLVFESLPRDLLHFGKLLAAWFMDRSEYKPFVATDPNLIADVIRGMAVVVNAAGTNECVFDEQSAEIRKNGITAGRVFSCSGSGTTYWAKAEAEMRLTLQHFRRRDKTTPVIFVATGVQGMDTDTSVPETLIPSRNRESVAGTLPRLTYFSPDEIKRDSARLLEALAV